MIIRKIVLDEVKVPAHLDSINSPETDHALHKLAYGSQKGWSRQFDELTKIIIQVFLDNGVVGLGETYRAVSADLTKSISQSLLGVDLAKLNFRDLPLPAGRSRDGFECALLDAFTKSNSMSLSGWLGGQFRNEISCAAWTGHRTTQDAIRKGKEAVEAGYRYLKFKCTLEDPVVEWCEGIHDACKDKLAIVLDPNERFKHPAHAERIANRLSRAGNVTYLEDPIPRWDMDSWRYLRQKVSIPLSMHVSLPYAEMGQTGKDALRAVRLQANDFFNFNCGVFEFQQLTAFSDLCEIPYSHGSEIDLGILEASYVHKIAASANGILPSDIFGRLIREHDLLKSPLAITNGNVSVPEGPGLGVDLDLDALAHYSLGQWEIEV